MSRDELGQERLVFPSLVEGYLKGLGDLFGEDTKHRLKLAGLDVTKLPPAIPADAMARYEEIIAQGAWPNECRTERLRLLGFHQLRGWQKGFLGAASTAMIRLIGPHRALTRLDRAFATTNNYVRAKTVFVGPCEALVTINEVYSMPSYWVGTFEAALELLALEGQVTIEGERPPEATFRIKWKE